MNATRQLFHALALAGWATAAVAASEVVFKDEGGKVCVEIGGQLFTEYHYQDVVRPYCELAAGQGSQ